MALCSVEVLCEGKAKKRNVLQWQGNASSGNGIAMWGIVKQRQGAGGRCTAKEWQSNILNSKVKQ